jgi:hypothetical protein
MRFKSRNTEEKVGSASVSLIALHQIIDVESPEGFEDSVRAVDCKAHSLSNILIVRAVFRMKFPSF